MLERNVNVWYVTSNLGKRDLGRITCRKVKTVEKDDYSAPCDAAVRHLKVKVSEVEPPVVVRSEAEQAFYICTLRWIYRPCAAIRRKWWETVCVCVCVCVLEKELRPQCTFHLLTVWRGSGRTGRGEVDRHLIRRYLFCVPAAVFVWLTPVKCKRPN